LESAEHTLGTNDSDGRVHLVKYIPYLLHGAESFLRSQSVFR